MCASDLRPKTHKGALTRPDLRAAIAYINDSRSKTLNITGGGEPFLRYANMLRMIESVQVPRIEIITSGHWATTRDRVTRVLSQIERHRARNPATPEIFLWVSIDRFHLNAPHPVPLSNYANIINAWSDGTGSINVGLRGILPDRGKLDRQLAASIGAVVMETDDWNGRIVLPNGKSMPISYSILRFSGRAAELPDVLRGFTKNIREYYKPLETGANKLSLATTMERAVGGMERDGKENGVAMTLASDGFLSIFCGTAPDRKLALGEADFKTSLEHFFQDPITHLLVEDGIWMLTELVGRLDPATRDRAVAKNDVVHLVDDLLEDDRIRLAVTLFALRRMVEKGTISLRDGGMVGPLMTVTAPEFIETCQEVIHGRPLH